jgi:hypothetical protein
MTFRAPLPFFLLLSWAVVSTAMPAQINKVDSTGASGCAVTHTNGIQPPGKDFGGTMTYPANYHGSRHTFPGSTWERKVVDDPSPSMERFCWRLAQTVRYQISSWGGEPFAGL